MTTLAVEQLSLAFRSQTQDTIAVENVSFVLQAAQTMALLGESGCGKSLTSLAIMRLLPENVVYATHTAIRFNQQDLLNISECLLQQLRGKRLAMIFQEPMSALNPVLSIKTQLREAILKHAKLNHRALEARMLQLLEEVEISNPLARLQQYPHQLSGGQKQRIVIAMALAHHPDVLIADEPTTALDASIQLQILKLLQKLQQQYRMSLLLITHDLAVVQMMAQHVCVMYAGEVIESSAAVDFFRKPLHPYVQQLLLAMPSMAKRNCRLQSIVGSVPQLDAMPSGCRFHPRCAHTMPVCVTDKPQPQMLAGRMVRCHLYPHMSQPPALAAASERRPVVQEASPVILRVSQLSVRYSLSHHMLRKNQVMTAVDTISFDLFQGKTLAVVGESGSGKTSLARAILQLLPMQGNVFYHGQAVSSMRGQALRHYRHKVQMVFQDPFAAMNPRMTVGDVLAEGMLAQHMSRQKISQRQKQLLDQVGLASQSVHRYPHQFSGGQRQRICIARALATEPEILICDEPTSALDVSIQAQILNLLQDLQDEYGLTYLLVTHNMDIVAYIADEVLVMRAGKMVQMGPFSEVMAIGL